MKSALVALVFVTGMTAGCGSLDQTVEAFYGKPVQVPIGRVSSLSQGDMTPPTVTLFLDDFGLGSKTLVSGGPDAIFSDSNSQTGFFVMAFANDPEGVKEVDIYLGGGPGSCVNGDIVASATQDIPIPYAQDTWIPNSSGVATTRRTAVRFVIPAELVSCPTGFKATKPTLTVQAAGVNFSAQRVLSPKAVLDFPSK